MRTLGRLARGPGSGTVELVPRLFTALLAISALSTVPPVAAQPRASGPGSDTCAARQGTALGLVACELARGLNASGTKVLVVTTALGGELEAQRRRELASRLSALVAGELGPEARAVSGIVPARAALGVARGARVIALSAELDRARLSASADVLLPPARFWARFAESAPSIAAHVFAARPLDSELRGYLPRVPLVVTKIHKASLEEPAVALACADLDFDGSAELAVIGRKRARVGRIVSGAFQTSKSALWADLSDLASAPLREPIATASVSNDGALLLGSTDRAHAVALDSELGVVSRYEGQLPWGPDGCAARSGLGLGTARVSCGARARASAEVVDAVAAGRTLGRTGATLPVLAARRQRDGHIVLQIAERDIELPDAVGAQLALGDLDGDGHVELLTTDPGADPSRDSLLVRTLSEDGRAKPALRIDVPGGVQAVTICPPGPNGFSAIALATGKSLWIVE